MHSVTITECTFHSAVYGYGLVAINACVLHVLVHGSVTVGDADCTELMCTSAVGRARETTTATRVAGEDRV